MVDIDHVKNDINCDFSGGGYKPVPLDATVYYVAMGLATVLLFLYASKQ